ncbi:methyltransferase domain-containing protein, partial [Flagelloscypha sp. PMI_526]
SIFQIHPNDLMTGTMTVPESWDWWNWAAEHSNPAKLLPKSIIWMLDSIKLLQRSREPSSVNIPASVESFSVLGQGPKKKHEVVQMASHIHKLLEAYRERLEMGKIRIVDVGAGQGYLTRCLANLLATEYPSSDPTMKRILAIDSDQNQTVGAKRWEDAVVRGKRPKKTQESVTENLIEHCTIKLGAAELLQELDAWLPPLQDTQTATPVLFVGLHACGSLTPSILRALSSASRDVLSLQRGWYPLGGVVVGCCYNLLEPKGTNESIPSPALPSSAYHLATQAPSTFNLSPTARAKFDLSVRKVVWRALLSQIMSTRTSFDEVPLPTSDKHSQIRTSGTGQTPISQRLGRLNDKAYDSWDAFLSAASQKMGLEPACSYPDTKLEKQLGLLQVLRCLLGPVVETMFLEDRLSWMKEEMGNAATQVNLVNLFDQATGSGRNVGILIECKGSADNPPLT